MENEPLDPIWEKLANRLFNGLRTTDERFFTARVMAQIRQLQPAQASWRLFVRWAVPALTLSMASLVLALKIPVWSNPLKGDVAFVQSQPVDEELADDILGEVR